MGLIKVGVRVRVRHGVGVRVRHGVGVRVRVIARPALQLLPGRSRGNMGDNREIKGTCAAAPPTS